VRFADYRDPAAFEKLIDGRTKAVFCESVGNPLGNITDFEKLAEIAHKHGVPVIVDNTVPSPYLCRPVRARRRHRRACPDQVPRRPRQLSIGGMIVDRASSRGPSTRPSSSA
jgi:hypothetical protein